MPAIGISVFILGLLAAQAGSQALPQRFSAFAVSTGGPRSGSVASQVEITITRWTTIEEAKQLRAELREQGGAGMLEALREARSVGTIKTPGNLAYDLRFAQQEPGPDGGRRIFLATDRPISFWEAVNQPRTIEYPFTFIELRMNGKGEGEGKLALATKIDVDRDDRVIQLVNYMAQPINLNQVKLESR